MGDRPAPRLGDRVHHKAFYDAFGELGWVVMVDRDKGLAWLATDDEWRRSDYGPALKRPGIPWIQLNELPS